MDVPVAANVLGTLGAVSVPLMNRDKPYLISNRSAGPSRWVTYPAGFIEAAKTDNSSYS